MDFLTRQTPWAIAFVLAVLLVGGYRLTFAPPADFSESIVVIGRGASAPAIAGQLATAQVIRHPALLQIALRLSGASERVQAGAYLFAKPENLFVVAYRISSGTYGLPPVRITFPEGITVRQIAALISEMLPEVAAADFLKAARPHEGYLFPDTYLFPPSADTASILALLRANFDTKIAPLAADIAASGRSISDIVTLASLVEKEGRTTESRRMVAGILLNRLKLGMPLQVDAVFGYINGRDTYSPSLADLIINSPYNTYTHKGLPPGPICNPGMDALQAVLHPTKSSYLYYLTGKDDRMHYATTFAEHQANRQKYLR
ncbi:MAG: endolytic transglycosylase MltG [Candidatus Kaiserbacteria bacterium]|nr:endolytic transglycosylase MltG [Candidatus Kaiserbacteria bacterium]